MSYNFSERSEKIKVRKLRTFGDKKQAFYLIEIGGNWGQLIEPCIKIHNIWVKM